MSRKIIIPQGIFDDPSQNNVIEIPTKLTRSKGNLIAKRQGNKIVAQQLPDWQDELSSNDLSRPSNIIASPLGCSWDRQDETNNVNDSSAASESYPSTNYSAANNETTNYSSEQDNNQTSGRTCYNTALDFTPSASNLQISGNELSMQSHVQSNIQMNDSMLASVLADTRKSLNTSENPADDSYCGFNPLLSSTQKSFEPSSLYDSSEESSYFFMGAPLSRSQEGKYNVITPMTPSPPRPSARNRTRSPQRASPTGPSRSLGSSFFQTPCARSAESSFNKTVPQVNQRSARPMSPGNQTFARPTAPVNQTFAKPTPPVNETFTRAMSPCNQTFARPTPPVNQTFTRPTPPVNQTFTRPTPPVNQTFTRPTPPVNQTFTRPASPANQTFTRPTPPVNRTFTRPTPPVNQTFTRPTPPVNQTFTRPASPANRTFVRPTPPVNQTFTRPTPPVNQTFTRPTPPVNQTFTRPTSSVLERSRDGSPRSNCSCPADDSYSKFGPLASSTQKSFEFSSSYFDDYSDYDSSVYDSSVYDSSDESGYLFMGAPVSRSQDGKYNIICNKTPSPPRNKSQNVSDDCACESDGNAESVVSYQSEVTEDVFVE